jgi:hypothetical protein
MGLRSRVLRRVCGSGASLGRIVPLLAIAAVLAGCGGGTTKADFVARADAICANTVRQTRSIPPPSFTHSASQRLSALAGYLAVVLPIEQTETNQIHALPRPTQDARARAALTDYLAALTKAVSEYGELTAAAKRGDAQGVANDEAALRANPVASLATSYGLRTCGTPEATVA